MTWSNIGGGCGLGCDRPEYPCDDEYKNTETGERITVYSTQEQHFELPAEVNEIAELYALEGVRAEWAEDAEAWKR